MPYGTQAERRAHFRKGAILAKHRKNRKHLWRTFDGRVMHIRDMDNQHLQNAIRLLQRERQNPQIEKLRLLTEERDFRRIEHEQSKRV